MHINLKFGGLITPKSPTSWDLLKGLDQAKNPWVKYAWNQTIVIHFVCIPGEEYGHSKKFNSLCSNLWVTLQRVGGVCWVGGVFPYVMYAFVRVPTTFYQSLTPHPPVVLDHTLNIQWRDTCLIRQLIVIWGLHFEI